MSIEEAPKHRPRRMVNQMRTSPTLVLLPEEILDVLATQEGWLVHMQDRVQALEHRLTDLERSAADDGR